MQKTKHHQRQNISSKITPSATVNTLYQNMAYFTIGNKILEYTRLSSTNKKVRDLNQQQVLEEGTIVAAFEQYAGKGYGSNSWESAAGENLTVSYLLRPGFLPPHQQFWLTRIVSLALRDTVSNYVLPHHKVSIKWPNDIYVDDKKIAGILIENNILGETIRESICGIGLNINQRLFESDAPNPVSLHQLTGEHYNIYEILSDLSRNINHWYEQLFFGKFAHIEDQYRMSLYRLDTESAFQHENTKFTGFLKGTDQYGRLLIETREGTINAFDFKEISFII
jgi:BirA family transcriptional regulator, biotin operon repressor / biotin---[acetyl-CoA-carboxylase] ligase